MQYRMVAYSDSLCNWHGEIEDLDTDQLVRETAGLYPLPPPPLRGCVIFFQRVIFIYRIIVIPPFSLIVQNFFLKGIVLRDSVSTETIGVNFRLKQSSANPFYT
jgi:hypothetical protein